MIFLYILLMILTLILVILFVAMSWSVYGWFVASAPFVPVRKHALPYILKALALSDTSVLYDLGSGDGIVLCHALKHVPRMRAVGVEIAPLPRMLSKICLWKHRKRAKILNADFFQTDFSEATHVFVYLYDRVLAKLEPHFDTQLKKGTRVVSCDFTFPNKTPVEIIEMKEGRNLAKKIYVYIW